MAAKKTAAKAPPAEKKEEEKKEPEKKAAAAPAPAPAPKKAAPPPEQPKSKFAEFLVAKKIDTRRVLSQSRALEGLQPEDRAIRLAKRLARSGAAAEGGEAKKETRKARSGRPVTRRAIHAALWGKFISGPTKTRILKAVNALLELKKAEKVDLKALF